MVDVKSKEYISANLLDLAPKIIKVAKRGPWAHQKPLNFWPFAVKVGTMNMIKSWVQVIRKHTWFGYNYVIQMSNHDVNLHVFLFLTHFHLKIFPGVELWSNGFNTLMQQHASAISYIFGADMLF